MEGSAALTEEGSTETHGHRRSTPEEEAAPAAGPPAAGPRGHRLNHPLVSATSFDDDAGKGEEEHPGGRSLADIWGEVTGRWTNGAMAMAMAMVLLLVRLLVSWLGCSQTTVFGVDLLSLTMALSRVSSIRADLALSRTTQIILIVSIALVVLSSRAASVLMSGDKGGDCGGDAFGMVTWDIFLWLCGLSCLTAVRAL